MTVAGAPLASAAEQNSAYARNKEGRFGKPGRPSLFHGPNCGLEKEGLGVRTDGSRLISMDEGVPRPRGRDEGTVISILILIGLVVLGFVYLPSFLTPISSNKQAPHNAMMQTSRQIGQMMFSYATDHGNVYPTGKSSTEVFQKLIDEDYCTDPEIFYLEMPGKVKPTSTKLKPKNV